MQLVISWKHTKPQLPLTFLQASFCIFFNDSCSLRHSSTRPCPAPSPSDTERAALHKSWICNGLLSLNYKPFVKIYRTMRQNKIILFGDNSIRELIQKPQFCKLGQVLDLVCNLMLLLGFLIARGPHSHATTSGEIKRNYSIRFSRYCTV